MPCLPIRAQTPARPPLPLERRLRACQEPNPSLPVTHALSRLCRRSAMSMERNCTILLHYDKNTPPNEDEIREELEHKEVDLARLAFTLTLTRTRTLTLTLTLTSP